MLIDEKFKKIQDLNLVPNNLKSVYKIIKYFDKENVEKINNNVISFIPNSSIQFDSQTEKVKLKDKYLLIYKNFVLVDKQITLLFEKYFGITLINYQISYIHKKEEGDFVVMEDPNKQKINTFR